MVLAHEIFKSSPKNLECFKNIICFLIFHLYKVFDELLKIPTLRCTQVSCFLTHPRVFHDFCTFHPFFLPFVFFRAAPRAYGGSQVRGLIGAVVAGLHHSHSNGRSEPTAHSNAGFLTHRARPGMEPEISWFLVGFVSAAPGRGTPYFLSLFSDF